MARARHRARRNLWRRDRVGHKSAAHIGWGYRSDRKRGPRPVMRYLSAAGLSGAALRKYRKGRKTSAKTLLRKRVHRKRRTGRPREAFHTKPFLVNSGRRRRAGSYAKFVGAFARRTGMSGPALMRAAGRAWRGGARRNADPFPMTNRGRRRHRSRRNQQPGLVYFNRKGRKGRGRKRSRRNGPILPYFAFTNRKHRSRRNGAILPYAAFNARKGAMEAATDAFETIIDVDFWKDTVLPMGAGFVAGQFAGGLVYGLVQKIAGDKVTGSGFLPALARVGSKALGSGAVAAAAFLFTKDRDVAGKVLAGGLVATLAAIIQEVFGMDTYSKITGMSGFDDMAADLTDELKARIAQSVRSEIARAEGGGVPSVSAFVNTQDLAPAPSLGPGPRIQGVDAFVNTQDLQTAPQESAPMVADLSAFSDSMADMMLV
jgi:hypothetical protein